MTSKYYATPYLRLGTFYKVDHKLASDLLGKYQGKYRGGAYGIQDLILGHFYKVGTRHAASDHKYEPRKNGLAMPTLEFRRNGFKIKQKSAVSVLPEGNAVVVWSTFKGFKKLGIFSSFYLDSNEINNFFVDVHSLALGTVDIISASQINQGSDSGVYRVDISLCDSPAPAIGDLVIKAGKGLKFREWLKDSNNSEAARVLFGSLQGKSLDEMLEYFNRDDITPYVYDDGKNPQLNNRSFFLGRKGEEEISLRGIVYNVAPKSNGSLGIGIAANLAEWYEREFASEKIGQSSASKPPQSL